MRECPKCHYVDPPYWRNRLFDYEVDICRLLDLESFDTDLMVRLLLEPRGSTIIRDEYAYKLTKTDWVYRIWLSLFKVRGWNPYKYYDPAGSKASMLRKQNLAAYNGLSKYGKGGSMNERRNMKSKYILQEIDQIRNLLNNLKE